MSAVPIGKDWCRDRRPPRRHILTPMPPADAPTLYLIDGHAHFFRAYHAISSGMTSPVTEEPTNLTFGFMGMLLKLLCRT